MSNPQVREIVGRPLDDAGEGSNVALDLGVIVQCAPLKIA